MADTPTQSIARLQTLVGLFKSFIWGDIAADVDLGADPVDVAAPAPGTTIPSLRKLAAILGANAALAPNTWVDVPRFFTLALSGTGTLTIDTKAIDGTVALSVLSFTASGAVSQIVFGFYGLGTTQIRGAFTGDLTAVVMK